MYAVHREGDKSRVVVEIRDDRFPVSGFVSVETKVSGKVTIPLVEKEVAESICRSYKGVDFSYIGEYLSSPEVVDNLKSLD
jgi:hypothetical protein